MSLDAILKETAERFGNEIGERVAFHLKPIVEQLEKVSGNEPPLPGLLSLKELADLLGIHRDTLRSAIDDPNSGIPDYSVPVTDTLTKYRRAQYEQWLATGQTEAVTV